MSCIPNRIGRRRRLIGALAAMAIVAVLISAPAAAPKAEAVGVAHYPISGVGSSWSANALQQWIRNVWDNYKWKVAYDDSGSSAGRQQFGQQNGGKDFAVSEIPYALPNSDVVDPLPARKFAYMPIVAGGTSFMYNLVIGGKKVTNLRLSGDNVSKVFTGVITKWDDPAIVADNPALQLPAIPIVPVVRSDGSGTTAQFTSWMFKQYPNLWKDYCTKVGKSSCGITSNYPVASGSPFVARSGSNSVAGYVAQAHAQGSITYVEYSYALNARFPVVKVLNGAGYYTEPTASNVAVALLGAGIDESGTAETNPNYLTQKLEGVYNNADPRSYQLSSYSYMLVPTALEYGFTEDKGLTLADFATYFLCEGQQQADVLGYSPLPINLVQAGLNQVKRIPGGSSDKKDIANCNNPTFSPDGSNKLAATAPQPQACDKKGPEQCATGTGGQRDTVTASTSATTAKGAAASGSAGTAGGAIAADGAVNSGTAEAAGGGSVSLGNGDARTVVAGVPVSLTSLPNVTLAGAATLLAGLLAVAGILAPPFLVRTRAAAPDRRRKRLERKRTRRSTRFVNLMNRRTTTDASSEFTGGS